MLKRLVPRRKGSKCRPSNKFITEGNEKVDEQATEGAMMDGGLKAQARASTVQQKKRRHVCSLTTCSQFSLCGRIVKRL